MVRHVVMFSFGGSRDAAQMAKIAHDLEALVGVVPGLVSLRAGVDLGLVDGNFDLAAVVDFVDEAAWRAYGENPDHLAVADGQIRPYTVARSAVQVTVD